jgi:glycosyltransferase involved in cell wall biosynthesis
MSVTGALRRTAAHGVLRLFTLGVLASLRLGRHLGRRPRCRHSAPGCRVLLTGTFYSRNWIAAHLAPLAASSGCAGVTVVSVRPVPELPGVEVRRPSPWVSALLGEVPSRLLTFGWVALRTRPCFVGGFHLLVNGLAAALVARLAGARAVYFCVGGPAEVLDGGIHAENRIYGLMETPDPIVERLLVAAVSEVDLVVTMGSGAARFLAERGVRTPVRVIAGGIDARRFPAGTAPPTEDLVFVGRLSPIKRVDLFLQAVAMAAARLPRLSAVVVGDGAERARLEALRESLGLEHTVRFVGVQVDVGPWLARARALVLTSDSEGLPLSVMEAMTAGLPVIASHVGDLPDLVEDGVNGFLVRERTAEAFADRIVALLRSEPLRARLSREASRAARRYTLEAATEVWESILGTVPREPALAEASVR